MGGVLILLAITFTSLLWSDLSNIYVWVVLAVMLAFGAIGWVDDYRKLILKHSRGLRGKWKYCLQSICGLIAAIYLYSIAQTTAETSLLLPFFKSVAQVHVLHSDPAELFQIIGFAHELIFDPGHGRGVLADEGHCLGAG